ncbi:MAG TPA: hypothetical protein VHA30_01880 [Patescibacteria group bacterium]|nr:hypothetical protein [Patescibacteria group bacterium]
MNREMEGAANEELGRMSFEELGELYGQLLHQVDEIRKKIIASAQIATAEQYTDWLGLLEQIQPLLEDKAGGQIAALRQKLAAFRTMTDELSANMKFQHEFYKQAEQQGIDPNKHLM